MTRYALSPIQKKVINIKPQNNHVQEQMVKHIKSIRYTEVTLELK